MIFGFIVTLSSLAGVADPTKCMLSDAWLDLLLLI